MRALQIVHGPEAGGVRTLSEIIAEGLSARGVATETVFLFPSQDAGLRAKLAGTWRVVQRILDGHYDAIIAYQASASILTGVIGWMERCPCRIVHQTALPSEVKRPMRWLDRLAGRLRLYTANVVNSRATQAAFADYPTRYRRDMLLIEHGVELPRPAHTRAETLAKFGIPDDGTILLNVGRLTAQKNQDVLIRALARLPHTRLVIAGDGPRRAEYQALAAQAGVSDRLHLLADVTRDDVADLLAAADVFVFPSTWETFGLAAVEAAVAGLPIIAADLPVLREVLTADRGAAATFVPAFDAEGWAKAITAATPPDESHRAIMAAVAERYSVTRMVDAYAALLARAPD